MFKVERCKTGTTLQFVPGPCSGESGAPVRSLTRGVGYYLEPILALAPFCKTPLGTWPLSGVTQHMDPGPDMDSSPLLSPRPQEVYPGRRGLEISASRSEEEEVAPLGRGDGGGFRCPVKKVKGPVQVTDHRGSLRGSEVWLGPSESPSVVIEWWRWPGLLLQFPDIYTH